VIEHVYKCVFVVVSYMFKPSFMHRYGITNALSKFRHC